ncbi:MAG: lysylphosphatidylglycerol synthase transmembrane domain-containing protein [Candidatus Nealsonbacteria bacterium]
MKKVLSFFISLFAGVGLLFWISRFIGWQETKSALLIFTGWHGMVIILLTLLMILAGAWKWKLILKSQGYDLSDREIIAPYLTCFSLIYLFPMVVFGGEIFRGYVLREKYNIPWTKAISSVFIDKILEVTSFLVTVLAGIAYFLLKIGLPPQNLCFIFGAILIVCIICIVFFYFKIFKRESVIEPLNRFLNRQKAPGGDLLGIENEIFKFFKIKKKVLWYGLGLAFLRVVISWARCWILILFLGKNISILTALTILGFYYLAMMIPIPAALGSHEAAQVFAFNALGLGSGLAPAFTMIQRGAELIMAFIGLVIFFKLGTGLLKALLFKKINSIIKQAE